MEETIKITLLGQDINISKQSINQLQPIITQQTLKEINLPPCLKHFQPDLIVLHSCVYYLIVVQRNLQQSHQLPFREKCLSNLSEYYIKHNMNFELYEYGFLSGKILSIPLDKAMHIIYFLVYTRLASKPFINNIIGKMEKKASQLKKKQIIKSQKEFSTQSKVKSNESRHLTIFCDSNQIESQLLKKELHKIMNPKQSKKMTKKVQNKRYFNLRKVYPENNDFKQQNPTEPIHYQSANTSRVVSIPVKVCSNENSSVITRLKLISGLNQQDSHFKKIQVRRQKFNQWFSSTAKYQQIMSQKQAKENKKPQWGTIKNILEKQSKNLISALYKNQKHPYEYYQNIASNIRNKNQQLDSIRYECFHHDDDKNIINPFKEPLSHNYYQKMLNKHNLKTQSSKIQTIGQNYKNVQTNREVIKQDYKQDFFIEKDCAKFSKTASMSKYSHLQDHGSIITRKNDAFNNQDETDMLFNKKVKNKFKLQKYKHEYRHFLKTQVFQRVKNSQ